MRSHEIDDTRIDLAELEKALIQDDGQAARAHLAAGRPIYCGDDRYPGQVVRQHPDGRREIVTIDDDYSVRVIREL